jgi:chromosomal replication initiator protein
VSPFSSPLPDPAHTFDTFVAGRSSRLAFDATVAVAENRADAHKPLFLRGKTGAGKTHLLDAIDNAVRAREPEAAILHMSAEAFVAEMLEAIRAEEIDALRRAVARFDVVLLDDLRLTDKPATREELFRCLAQVSRLVIASDTEFPDSPFVLGQPDFRTRLAIARRTAARYDLELSEDVLKSIARGNTGSPRAIQSAIARMSMEMRIATPAPAPSPRRSHPPRTP